MLELTSLINFILTALTAWPGEGGPLLAPGVHAHGLIGVVGFSYSIFLHFLLTPDRYGQYTPWLRRAAALLSLTLSAGALMAAPLLINTAAAGYLLTNAALLRLFKSTAGIREDLFMGWGVFISLLCWIYLLFSLNFQTILGLNTRLSYSLLAFSFPMSLLLFSRYVDYLDIGRRGVILTALVLIGGVLSLFAGMLTGLTPLEIISATFLLVLIAAYLRQALIGRDLWLTTAFIGLLLTGLSGVWHLLAYKSGYGQEIVIIKGAHAHLAHFAWATLGVYILLLREEGKPEKIMTASLPLWASLALLVTHICTAVYWLLPAATVLFLLSAMVPARRLLKM